MSRFRNAVALAATLAVATAAFNVAAARAQQQGKPGDFDYYALVLSWSPTYCAGGGARDELQCNGSRPYAFVLHGLWPQYERGYPQSCRTRDKPWVPRKTIDRMLDIMPSPRLVIHEYKSHGTCSGLTADAYFDLARKLYDRIAIPPRYRNTAEPLTTSPAEVEREFLTANPKLKADMLAVVCGKPNRLREIRICFSPGGDLRSCGGNEDQSRLCRADRIVMPPVRGKAFGKANDPAEGGADDNPI